MKGTEVLPDAVASCRPETNDQTMWLRAFLGKFERHVRCGGMNLEWPCPNPQFFKIFQLSAVLKVLQGQTSSGKVTSKTEVKLHLTQMESD